MILCAGEALIDMLPRQSAEGEACFRPVAGGAVFNTAIALGRLGIETEFYSGVSTDMFGQQLERTLHDSNVGTQHLHRSDKPTTMAFVELVNGHARYAFYDEGTAGRTLRRADLPKTPVACDAAFFGGISLVSEPCGSSYETLARRLSKTRVIMIDPNIRESFITDETAYRKRIDAMLGFADIVKLSDEDARWLFGDKHLTEIANEVLERGAKMVCLTEGAKGVTACLPGQTHVVLAEKAKVVDTVGAGDTFNAGVLAGLSRAGVLTKKGMKDPSQEAVLTAVQLGARAAAVTVSRAGANPPLASEIGF